MIKEFGHLDKKNVPTPIPEEKVGAFGSVGKNVKTDLPSSPNINKAKNEAHQLYFIKRLRVNVEKLIVLVKEWKYIQRRRMLDSEENETILPEISSSSPGH